ncbi:MAG: lipase family protein [Actinomycetota bacterium]
MRRRLRSRRLLLAALAALTLGGLLVGCGGSDGGSSGASTTTTSIVPASDGMPDFYAVSYPLEAAPGRMIKVEPVAAEGLAGKMFRVMYTTRTQQGGIAAVTGLVAVPEGTPPEGGFPVVSWAHGTDGMADRCAPSLNPGANVGIANLLLKQGWVIVATDYVGEGTPGLMPYIAGESAARNAIDIVRAARAIPDTRIGSQYIVWGHSQGGHTAMHALRIGSDYAPELDQRGVVAGAPPSQFPLLYDFLKQSPFKHYLLMAAGGINAAYGDEQAPLDAILTPAGMELLPILDEGCVGEVGERLAPIDAESLVKMNPFENDQWKQVLTENDPQSFTTTSPTPLLIIHGGNDEQIPTVSSEWVAKHLCGLGQDLSRWVYPGQSHAGVVGASVGDMLTWMEHRFAGDATPDPMTPTGQDDVIATRCPSAAS